MAKTLTPRPAGPKAVRRWVAQALDLVGRGFHVWVAMMICFCLVMYGAQRSIFLGEIIALSAYFAGIGVAAMLDDRTKPGFIAVVRRLFEDFKGALLMGTVIIGIGTVVGLLLGLIFRGTMDFTLFYNDAKEVIPAGDEFMPAMRAIFGTSLSSFFMALLVMNVPMVSSFFQYHCMSLLGMSWRMAYWNGDGAIEKNMAAIGGIVAVLFSVPLLLLGAAPFLAPIFYCFASAFTYVAFREIYLGIDENRKIVLSEAPTLAFQAQSIAPRCHDLSQSHYASAC